MTRIPRFYIIEVNGDSSEIGISENREPLIYRYTWTHFPLLKRKFSGKERPCSLCGNTLSARKEELGPGRTKQCCGPFC